MPTYQSYFRYKIHGYGILIFWPKTIFFKTYGFPEWNIFVDITTFRLFLLNSNLLKMIFKWKSVFLDVFDSLYSLEFSFSWSFIFGHKSSKFSVTFHIIVLTRARWSTLFFYSLSNKLTALKNHTRIMVLELRQLICVNRRTINSISWRYSDICLTSMSCVTHVSLVTHFCGSVTVTLCRKWFLKSSKSNK